ncbi:hypothetical protein L596_001562 [Steinernema carpocapsae]|uniref:RRM domain-containing protein n=1 Tax=Steinernema carpocapsae TaxID=34508 RepID=A0A4V6YST9_STECR|nr:hypothetical protein L596_001562 [Steinernema carpocapsae]
MGSNSDAPCKVLHVSNICPTVTRDQLYQLFAIIGRIDEVRVYPTDTTNVSQKFAFVKFEDRDSVSVGQHLTNTVFIDRAVVCVPAGTDEIPDEHSPLATGTLPGSGPRQLPPNLTNEVVEEEGRQLMYTHDPTLTNLALPPYPPLPGDTEMSKVEEIRRTIYVGNLPKNVSGDDVVDFFNSYVGEVMYVRLTSGNDNLPCAYAYVEFSSQASVPTALQNDGIDYEGNSLRITHSRVAIIKPQRKTDDQALAEVNEAIRNQKEEKNAPLASTLSGRGMSPRRRSRTRSPPRRRRSRSPYDRDRRERDRERDREVRIRDYCDRDRDRRDRDRSKDRRRDRSRERIRDSSQDRERDRDRRDRDRDRKKEKERRDRRRSRSPRKDRKDSKERDRDRERERRDRERREDKDKDRRKKRREEDSDDEEVLRERLLANKREREEAQHGAE